MAFAQSVLASRAEFLRKEVETPANRPAFVDQRPRGRDMGLQAIELLADVGLGGKQDSLLMEAVLVEAPRRAPSAPDRSGEPLADRLGLARRIVVGGLRRLRDC